MEDQINVLFLAADPFRDRAPLRLDEEVRAIDHALRKGHAHDGVKLVPYFAARTNDLQHALMRYQPRIVHFAGHGGAAGVIYLGDAYGRPGKVSKDTLAELFGLFREWIKVVILNGCDTLPIVDALADVMDYAIGMSQPLTDASAIVFSEAFYGALGMGMTVQASFDLAVNQLRIDQNEEASIPVLRIRPGVDPSVPLVTPPARPPAPAGNGAAAVEPRAPGILNEFKTFHGDDVLIENRPGDATAVNRIDHVTGRKFVFRNN